jgi:aminoglycoside phosphotransferase (APT) family kinase protein
VFFVFLVVNVFFHLYNICMAVDLDNRLLKETFGSKACVSAWEPLKDRPDYRVWKVDLQHPSLSIIVKLAGAGAEYSSSFERAAAIHRLVREQTTIPIPEVFLADESCRKWPWRVFIKEYLPGVEFADIRGDLAEAELRHAQAQIGDAVAQIHAVRFAGFGEIDQTGQVVEPSSCIKALEAHARRIIRSQQDQERFLAYLEQRSALFTGEAHAGLCHEDLHKHNILFRRDLVGWRLAAILDFEKAWAGPRESDLARMDLWKMTSETFWMAYQARQPVDPGYSARCALYQLLWCLEVAWDTAEHQATLQSILRKLDETI